MPLIGAFRKSMGRKKKAPMADNIWKRSADPKKRAEAYKKHEKAEDEHEMRTKNVMRQSLLDQVRHKPGKEMK